MDSMLTMEMSGFEAPFDTFLKDVLAVLYERRAAIDHCMRSLQALPRHHKPEPKETFTKSAAAASELNPPGKKSVAVLADCSAALTRDYPESEICLNPNSRP
jgi:hypothetical protein